MARIPAVVGGLLQGTATVGAPGLAVGSPEWFAWLADDAARSFSFRSAAGAYTARKERRQRGGAYWVAYRTAAGRKHKVYLGRAAELTPERLAEAAAKLAGLADRGGVMLLSTKLFVPRPRADLVLRPRLIAHLNAGLAVARCSLLSAPAGAGKTSLLAAWLAQVDRPVGWLALDERDQTVNQVLRYLVAACQAIAPTCGRKALAWLDAPSLRPEAVVTELVNDVARLPAPGVLVLDDYHLVRDPAVHEAIAFLLDHLPPALHLVIASREDPPLPLPRLRARRQLAEVRATDLGFSVDEAAAFLDTGLGLRLPEEQVAMLVDRTEGWAAGLQLAGLAMRDRPDAAAFAAAFTGGHRLVADYLLAEVLDRQPPATRRFLLTTSVLDRLCAPLCDALLAEGGGDSQETLEDLERANLFLVPLDDERVWYRYHHLFADALRARLAREEGADAVAALHRRVAGWCGREGLLPEAIGHALAGGAAADAATWIEALIPKMFATMSIHRTLAGWLDELGEPLVRARPLLCLARVWLLVHRVELNPAAAWLEAAESALDAADGGPVRGAVAATRAYLSTVVPDTAPHRAIDWAERALADLAPDDMAYRGIAGVSLGQAALALGDLDRAERAFADAAAVDRAAGLVQGTLTAATQQVTVLSLRGARRGALDTGQAALAWAGEHVVPSILGRLRTVLAELRLDADDVTAALPLATDGIAALREFGNAPPLLLLASLPLVRLHLARGDVEAADAVLADVGPLVRPSPFVMVVRMLEAAEARVALARGDTATAVALILAAPVGPTAPPDLFRFGAAAVEAAFVTPARILVAHGRATGDIALLQQAKMHLNAAARLAEEHGVGWLRLRVAILRAMLADARGDRPGALGSLAEAVAQADPEGVTRPFLDEGEPMAALLADLRTSPREIPASSGLVDALTERELEVLRLLAAGCSNAAMAADLFVEQSTIKTHLIHVYVKLGVHSRTQAVARGRALGLLD
ncbi:LuxR C-terminal-related transcriptional regulator [Paractinoplanes rishiriensis]|uniref:LuxR family transcriptional regulator n=1 Tax=Paractinoplanes rishiriensis TaxID=1050105 RepID=A0A919MX55_9ACTN|nr:LuxR C-terminal-related transcriptional regulator [Actinoplanes rishiriensis]GIE98543.1 LuxR family transcriptional regulator [Actinoplanes rishiriensis]